MLEAYLDASVLRGSYSQQRRDVGKERRTMRADKRRARFGHAYVAGNSSFDQYLRRKLRASLIRKYYVRAMRKLERNQDAA